MDRSFCRYRRRFVNALGSFYLGYAPTAVGAIIGGIYALVDGAIGGYVVAYVYNWASEKL